LESFVSDFEFFDDGLGEVDGVISGFEDGGDGLLFGEI
jgi:hypothetical protein